MNTTGCGKRGENVRKVVKKPRLFAQDGTFGLKRSIPASIFIREDREQFRRFRYEVYIFELKVAIVLRALFDTARRTPADISCWRPW